MARDNSRDLSEGDIREIARRRVDGGQDDADWETKALDRVRSHLDTLHSDDETTRSLGWESSILDALRRKIERGPQ
jgi:hypothetical protein